MKSRTPFVVIALIAAPIVITLSIVVAKQVNDAIDRKRDEKRAEAVAAASAKWRDEEIAKIQKEAEEQRVLLEAANARGLQAMEEQRLQSAAELEAGWQ